jgi:hypothetical protein
MWGHRQRWRGGGLIGNWRWSRRRRTAKVESKIDKGKGVVCSSYPGWFAGYNSVHVNCTEKYSESLTHAHENWRRFCHVFSILNQIKTIVFTHECLKNRTKCEICLISHTISHL